MGPAHRSERTSGTREAVPLSVPTSHDNLIVNQGWVMRSLPVGCTSEIKRQKGGEGGATMFPQEGKKSEVTGKQHHYSFPSHTMTYVKTGPGANSAITAVLAIPSCLS